MVTQSKADLRSVDRELLAALRMGKCMGVGALTKELGVTATAVRQRIDRLMEKGLIEREKVVSGRGRPTFCYRLTLSGNQRAGADPSDLADALWQEVIGLSDDTIRNQILTAVAKRLGRQFAYLVETACEPPSQSEKHDQLDTQAGLRQRMDQLSQSLSERKIPIVVSDQGEIPVLDIESCPFPTLTDHSNGRTMCRLEEQIFSEALGQPVKLSSCRLDGDNCCQFSTMKAVGPIAGDQVHVTPASTAGG